MANESYSSNSTVHKILNVTDLISQALLENNQSSYWINPITTLPVTESSLKEFTNRFFYGLLYQQLIQIPEFKNYFESQDSNNIVTIATKIQNLISIVNKLNITQTRMRYDHSISSEDFFSYTKEINDIIFHFTALLNKNPEFNKHYHLKETTLNISTSYITILETCLKKDYQKVIPLLIIELGDYIMENNIKSTRTLSFVSKLATIENSNDMKTLLDSYALPIGSASIKRHSKFNLTVNGYVGWTSGFETAYGTQKNQTLGNIGLTTPIGLSATYCNGYLTTFLTLIDLGSVVNQRLNNDTTSYSNLKIEQFLNQELVYFSTYRNYQLQQVLILTTFLI